MQDIRAAILILSDKSYHGEREDLSGPAIREMLEGRAIAAEPIVLPDDRRRIADELKRLCDSGAYDLVFTSGGTGFAPRDVTPEATMDVIERPTPGIPEAIRQKSMQITDRAMLSRAAAGIRGRTLILNMPGSPKAVRECLEVFLPVMNHAVETIRGDAYECARE